jgi:hypothetical protein
VLHCCARLSSLSQIVGDPVGQMGTAMEGAGGIGTINELLLQSHTGVLELFPQVPPGTPVSFDSLRARGAFLVSASMASGVRKKIVGVTIVSEVGRAVTLRTPWDCMDITVVATPGGVVTPSSAGDTISWDTKAGVSYAVAPSC